MQGLIVAVITYLIPGIVLTAHMRMYVKPSHWRKYPILILAWPWILYLALTDRL
jgi:hypothetical protein